MEESSKDVTQRILDRHIIYGGSDGTNSAYYSSNKSLNYATGGSIARPENDKVSIIPFTINYNDTVGLFGSENHFVRVNVEIDTSVTFECFEGIDWSCASITEVEPSLINTYSSAVIDIDKDLTTVNTYEPVELSINSVATLPDSYLSVDLNNLKTGNKYIDAWFDVRLYNRERQEHPYDKMYVRLNDYFYIGFHARNTRRLPYNVKCVIGQEYISGLNTDQKRYANRA
jgi:hypothetical protein